MVEIVLVADRNRFVNRSAMSLVELLCIIAIIGILLSLVLPAVQSVRESTRRSSCSNNLRNLGMAAMNHESAHQRFPPGTLGDKKTFIANLGDLASGVRDPSSGFYLHNNQNTSWILHLIPHLEQASLANQIPSICTDANRSYREFRNSNPNAPRTLLDDSEVQVAMKRTLPVLLCASDNLLGEQMTEYKGGSQPAFVRDFDTDAFLYFEYPLISGGTNYAACSGASSGGYQPHADISRFGGLFRSRTRSKFSEITDGASNSIALGETLGGIMNRERKMINPWFFAAMCRGRSDLEWMSNNSLRTPGLELIGDQWFAFPAGFASKHLKVANFCFADGSVRAISRTIELRLFYSLCGIADSEQSNSE